MSGSAGGSAELHLRESGEGVPILLVHGLGGDHTVWNGQIGPLAEKFRVLAPDLRGHGRSPTPEGSTFGFDELEDDLFATLDRRGLSAVHLAGTSAGGFLALRIALDRPDRVRSLILLSTAAHADGHTRAVAQHWTEVLREQGYEAYVRRLLKDLYYAEFLEAHLDLIDQTLAALRHRDLRAVVQWGAAIKGFDVRARLGRVALPTLVLHGMEDRVIDASHARVLRQAIRGAELKLFPYVGHMLPVERPEEVTQLIRDWVSTNEDRGKAAVGSAPETGRRV
ncbi:MAG: alpha/beta fold hydrolase [Thermoplasmata archaeon]